MDCGSQQPFCITLHQFRTALQAQPRYRTGIAHPFGQTADDIQKKIILNIAGKKENTQKKTE